MSESSDERSIPSLKTGSPCLQGECVAFTGILASMTHRQAFELVEQHGGGPTTHVNRQTTMLVIGEEGWPLEADGRPSQKLLRADEHRKQGQEIRFLRESEWLHLLGLEECRREVHRLYTPAMLSQLLDVPVGVIRSWERAGLVRAACRIYRLPYFDFQEMTCARRIAELIAAGVPRKAIQAGLEKMHATMSHLDSPLAQLDILGRGSRMLYRDDSGLVESISGQRCFDFDAAGIDEEANAPSLSIESADFPRASPATTPPPDWFIEGCRLLDDGDLDAAIEAFRLFLMQHPGDAEANFFLAEILFRQDNRDGAIERYYAAVEADHEYIEAWTQLGCLLADADQAESALAALDIALSVHPDYPDAHLHKAELLHQTGDDEQAIIHWQAYLQYDSRGPWAQQARQRLQALGCEETAVNLEIIHETPSLRLSD
jgi:tetratricopeptide (TPR) repeat protein